MNFRVAREADLETVHAWLSARPGRQGPLSFHHEAGDDAVCTLAVSATDAIVLEDPANGILGFAQLSVAEEKVGRLERVIVKPDIRRQGVARRLCVHLMKIGWKQHGVQNFAAAAHESDVAALALFSALGFEVRNRKGDGWVGLVSSLTTASTSTKDPLTAP